MNTIRHFPQFTLQRLNGALERLRESIWHDPITCRVARAGDTKRPKGLDQVRKSDFRRIEAPVHWGRMFQYTWFRVELPTAARGAGRRFLRWRDQGEATLYVHGEPYYGFDVAHRCAPLPENVRTVYVESMCCQSAIWHPAATGIDRQGSRFDGAEIVFRNDDAWHAWHDLVVLQEVIVAEVSRTPDAAAHLTPRPGVRPPFRALPAWMRSLIEAVDRAIDAWEKSGLSALRRALKRIYARFPAEWHQLRASLIGHAHIDLVWMWPEVVGETKAVHTFATVLRLMELYPEFRFSYSQPASYEAVVRHAPSLAAPIRKRIRQRRWELLGAAYVESDTVLPCGEALLRSLLLGQDARSPWTNEPARLLWLPDVFGYAGCLPRLMRMAGIRWFFTNKVAWRRVTHFPHSSFRWRGIDGSEVLAHVSFEIQQSYNGTATVRELQDAAGNHQQAHLHPEALVPTGYGDGGGGPTEEMCERARRLANLVSVPRAEWGTAESFFEKLEPQRDALPVWNGEIYLQMHRGTYTTQAHMKAAYRAAERGLQTLEAAHCVLGRGPIDVGLWKRLIFAQFHDALPGSSFHEAYAEMVPELEVIAEESKHAAGKVLSAGRGGPCVFNPLPIPVRRLVSPARGRPRMIQLPPLGGVSLGGVTDGNELGTVSVRGRVLANERSRLVLTPAGEVESLVVDGRRVALREPGGQLWLYPDFPHDYPAWEVDPEALRLGWRVRGGRKVGSRGDGALEGEIVFERPLPEKGGVARVSYRLRAGEPFVRVKLVVDWKKPQTLLRWVFPTDYRGANVRFGAPYGSVLRPQLAGKLEDESYWESPGSRWAMVADDGEGEGLFVVTEAKYGYEAFEGSLATTLLRSAWQTGEMQKYEASAPSSLRVSGRDRFTDLGTHEIGLAFGRFDAGAPREELPAALADALFTGPVSYRGRPATSGFLGIEGGASLLPAWARPLSKDRWLLRLHETLGRRGTARIRHADGVVLESVGERDSRGEPIGDEITFAPYEVLSVVLRRR